MSKPWLGTRDFPSCQNTDMHLRLNWLHGEWQHDPSTSPNFELHDIVLMQNEQ
jgi:hypothetical protein